MIILGNFFVSLISSRQQCLCVHPNTLQATGNAIGYSLKFDSNISR